MQTWVLIIAVEDYPKLTSGWVRTLPSTNQAAADFREWAMTVKNVPASNIIACADASCAWRTTGNTRKEIEDAFTALVKQARDKAAEVYVLFSGHGIGFKDDPNEPPVDLIAGSEFDHPSTSGGACLKVTELRERLRYALGPGKHFYFIDACRNSLGKGDISPSNINTVWGRSKTGNATTFVLFSTAPGDVAKIDSGFNAALLSGLKGSSRAKAWVGGKMYVTFDSLCLHVQRLLKKDDLEPEKRGPLAAKGDIVELNPIPQSNCVVEVIGAAATDQFTLDVADVRNAPRPAIAFAGPRATASFAPEDYLFRLRTTTGVGVPQIDPPFDLAGVDLYEDRRVQFQVGPGAPPQIALGASTSSVQISAPFGADVSLENITRGTTRTLRMDQPKITTSLEPGHYNFNLRDGNFNLRYARSIVAPGETQAVSLDPRPTAGAQTSIARALPNYGMSILFSETLGNVLDWDLSLWLALLGGARILAPREKFTKLRSFALETFDDARPDKSVLYVLAGEQTDSAAPLCGAGFEPRPMERVADLPGVFQTKLEFEPGPLLVTYAAGTASTTIATHGVPNRVTLLTVARDEKGRQRLQQFILPTYALNHRLSGREREYLERKDKELLQLLRYMSTAQRLFEQQAPIEGITHRPTDAYWLDLLYGKWLDPVMALIACYELIRRGTAANQLPAMREVLGNMRTYFPGFADTEVIAKLVNQPFQMPQWPPILMDGVLALGTEAALPLGTDRLDYDSVWTSWRNAFARRGVGAAIGRAAD